MDDMDSDMMVAYEAYLKRNGVSPKLPHSIRVTCVLSITVQWKKDWSSRNFPLSTFIREWRRPPNGPYPLWQSGKSRSWTSHQARHWIFARNMFLFSFYTRGMSFVDMAYLRKKDLNNGIFVLSTPQDRTAAFHQMGEMHAGDSGQVQYGILHLSATRHQP